MDTPLTATTKYPIVLIHGLFGFEKIANYPYFYGVAEALTAHGTTVFTAIVSATNTTAQRAEQLLPQIQQILEITKADKVNLIGHSHGALTARYVAAHNPQLIASVSSVNGVNHGSEIADMMLKALQNKLSAKVANSLITNFVKAITLISTKPHLPQDFIGALNCLSTAGVADFNNQYPQGIASEWGGETKALADNGVYYYSWSGIINKDPAFKKRNHPLYAIALLNSRYFKKEVDQNDGFVGRFSSHLGEVIRSDYPMDHFAAINQLAGKCATTIDPVALYIEHACRLKSNGL